MMTMTFHESYGPLPTVVLRDIRKFNVSPADYDAVLAHFGRTWQAAGLFSAETWSQIHDFIVSHSSDGIFRISRYA